MEPAEGVAWQTDIMPPVHWSRMTASTTLLAELLVLLTVKVFSVEEVTVVPESEVMMQVSELPQSALPLESAVFCVEDRLRFSTSLLPEAMLNAMVPSTVTLKSYESISILATLFAELPEVSEMPAPASVEVTPSTTSPELLRAKLAKLLAVKEPPMTVLPVLASTVNL